MPRPPARKKRKRKQRRRKSGVKITIAVTLCIAAVSALGTGIWFIVDQVTATRQQQKSDGATSSDVRVHTFGQITFECPKSLVVKPTPHGDYNVADPDRVITVTCQLDSDPEPVETSSDELLRNLVEFQKQPERQMLSSRVAKHKNGFEYVFVEMEMGSGRDTMRTWNIRFRAPNRRMIWMDIYVYLGVTPWSEAKPIFQKIVDSIRIRK